MAFNIQEKKYPKLYDFNGNFICKLTECINISESLRFGGSSELNFQYPRHKIGRFSIMAKDEYGNPIISQKYKYIENDMRVLFNDRWYVLKIDEDNRDEENKLFANCKCHEIQYLLQEKMVEYLQLTPPMHVAVNATTAISEVLEAAQQLRDGYVVSGSGISVVIDTNAHPSDDIYNGYKFKVIGGTGSGQEKTITDYNGTTKTLTLDSSLTTALDTTSVYRIYNDEWKVGTVDSEFNTELRSHYFDFVNALDALGNVRDKYFDSNDEVGYLTYQSSFNEVSGKWESVVNLVRANDYNGVWFRYKKNMMSIIRRKDTQELYTKIIPIGVDNLTIGSIASSTREDYSVTYYEHVYGHNAIFNFQYFLGLGYTEKECMDKFIKTYYFEDSRYTDANDLYDDAKAMLEKSSLPKFTYIISALDLSTLTGREYESFSIGDTVRVYDEEQNIDIYAVVSAINRNQENPQNADIEITNFIDRISDILMRIINRNDKYTDKEAQFGSVATYIVADKLTSKNWRQADFVVQEFESASSVLQKLINSIDSSNGARIILLDGSYYFDSGIILKSNISFYGQGASTILIPLKNGIDCIDFLNVENITLSDFYIISNVNYGYRFQNGISIKTSLNVDIKNISILDTSSHHIIASTSSNILCSNIYIGFNNSTTGFGMIRFRSCNNIKCDCINIFPNAELTFVILVDDFTSTTSYGDFYFTNIKIVIDNINCNIDNIFRTTTSNCKTYFNNNSIIITDNINRIYGDIINISSSNNEFKNNKIEGFVDSSNPIYIIGNYNIISDNTLNVVSDNTGVSGIYIIGNENNIKGNTIKRTSIYSSQTLLDYGINLASGSNNIISSNDLSNSGTISSFYDGGSGTIVFGGNNL